MKDPERILDTVWKQCEDAADRYWCKYWPCRYQKEGWGRCVNGPKPHINHQSREVHGNVVGGHDASHNLKQLQQEFRNALKQELCHLVSNVKPTHHRAGNLQRFSQIHRQNTETFYQSLEDVGKLLSYATCFSCLNGIPEHCLPCGHVICSACVTESGKVMDGGFVQLNSCPLKEHDEKLWNEPWTGSIKPEQAGLRIMTLDG